MSDVFRCPMCGHEMKVDKEVAGNAPLLCPECLLKNEHMDKISLGTWIKMELIAEEQRV